MLQDGKTSSSVPSSPCPSPELPPSYDFATALAISPAGASTVGSSSRSQETQSQLSHIAHLFTTPPSAEPILGRPLAPADLIAGIEVKKGKTGLVSHDPNLANRILVLYDLATALTLDSISRRSVRVSPCSIAHSSSGKAPLYRYVRTYGVSS